MILSMSAFGAKWTLLGEVNEALPFTSYRRSSPASAR